MKLGNEGVLARAISLLQKMDSEKTKNARVIRGRDCQNGFVRLDAAAAAWGINADIVIGRVRIDLQAGPV